MKTALLTLAFLLSISAVAGEGLSDDLKGENEAASSHLEESALIRADLYKVMNEALHSELHSTRLVRFLEVLLGDPQYRALALEVITQGLEQEVTSSIPGQSKRLLITALNHALLGLAPAEIKIELLENVVKMIASLMQKEANFFSSSVNLLLRTVIYLEGELRGKGARIEASPLRPALVALSSARFPESYAREYGPQHFAHLLMTPIYYAKDDLNSPERQALHLSQLRQYYRLNLNDNELVVLAKKGQLSRRSYELMIARPKR